MVDTVRKRLSKPFLLVVVDFFTAADTQLTGEILPYFEGRTNLQVLGVGENRFVGSIPTFLGEFTQLGKLLQVLFAGMAVSLSNFHCLQ